jgi:UDP-N-acetyl-D-glucosamine dehydrogenase
MKKEFLSKLHSNDLTIGIIGMGYVGIPLALRFSEVGIKSILGFDILQKRVDLLNAGTSYLKHISDEQIAAARHKGFRATAAFSESKNCDALIICVPTPLSKYREPDITYIIETIDSLLPFLREGQLISLESTTYPGTTEEELKPRLEEKGFTIGEDFFLVFSPEREDPGNTHYSTQTIPKVIGGTTPNCLEVGIELYKKAIDTLVPLSSTKAAELAKLLENIHRSVNIGLVNEMKIVADKMGIDIFEVIEAAATKPFGFTPYYPGPGLGGHCIPVDPFYLTWKAREYGIHTRFIELAGEINSSMPEWVVNKVAVALNKQKKPLNGSKILIIGIAYKKNIDDCRESPSLELIKLLKESDAEIDYHDSFIPQYIEGGIKILNQNMVGVDLSPTSIPNYDAILIATDHDNIDYEMLYRHAKLIIDTRGRYKHIKNPEKIVAA